MFLLTIPFVATGFAAARPSSPPGVVELPVTPDGQPHIPVRIKRADVDVRIALSYDTALVLNSGAAARAELKAFPLIGKRTFKSALIPGGEATFRGNLYGITPHGLANATVPVIWVDKPVAADADGVLSITALKADHIIFSFGPITPGSKTYAIPRKSTGSAMMEARVGDETISVALELNAPDTVMNARAAAALANTGVVKRGGNVGFWKPFPGIALPFERLDPATGARLFGLPLVRPAVRVTEAQAKALDARSKAGTSTADDDADAITVTASRKRGRAPWLLIGRDMLAPCSRIEFDRPGKRWLLTCAF